MELTFEVVFVVVAAFLALIVGGGIYEIWTLRNDTDNDTISHAIGDLTEKHPNLPVYVCTFWAVFVLFGTLCTYHWWYPNFKYWPAAKRVEDDKEQDDRRTL